MEKVSVYTGWLREVGQSLLWKAGRLSQSNENYFRQELPLIFQALPGGDMKIVSTVAVIGLKSLSTLQFSYYYTFHSVPIS